MKRLRNSLRMELILLVIIAIVPAVVLNVFLLRFILEFQGSYDEIVGNMTIANSYNLNFKEELDECIYKLVFNGESFEKKTESTGFSDMADDRNNPYVLIDELREDFDALAHITTDRESRTWLNSLLRNIDTLEDRMDDLRINLAEGGHYNENIEMLDNNIYILTELSNDDIQHYIYYQTRSIELVQTELSSKIRSFTSLATFLTVLIIAVVVVSTVMILRKIMGPLGELTRVTERIAQGDFNARAGVYTNDEIGQVAGAVNDMAQHLEVMVEQIKEDERKMRNAELRLLQEQINPHFLYNTLDTIVWLIEGGKNEEAEDMVMSLSNFFKLVLNSGREIITVRDEELHIRSYLQIQQVRYRDILDYEIDIDPGIYNYKILKLTLQPLVENALYHGIKPLRAKGLVRITGRMNDEDHTICFWVEDNGVGMSKEDLEAVRKEIELPGSYEKSIGFGMANVNERIRLNFGREYGMTIDSQPDVGTKVSITIPAQWVRQNENLQETVSERRKRGVSDEQ